MTCSQIMPIASTSSHMWSIQRFRSLFPIGSPTLMMRVNASPKENCITLKWSRRARPFVPSRRCGARCSFETFGDRSVV